MRNLIDFVTFLKIDKNVYFVIHYNSIKNITVMLGNANDTGF